MKLVVFTSDHHSWLLRGFFHQWEKYGAHGKWPVEVAGFSLPSNLPKDVNFYSIGRMEDYPVSKWSNAVIKYLTHIDDDLVLIMLEDYWMLRRVNFKVIEQAEDFMFTFPNTLRFDLTSDRMFNRAAKFIGNFGDLDICSARSDYSLSFQASIYNRKLLLEVMRENETPWATEIDGTRRANTTEYGIVGSYQWPMNYMIVVNKGVFDRRGSWMHPARTLISEDWRELDELGYTKKTA